MYIMSTNYDVKMCCSAETRDKIIYDCVEEYLKHHPEMRGKNITQGHILRQLAEHYLKY